MAVRWDAVAIGGGPGATPGAQWLAARGQRVAIVEQGSGLGGTCLFEGCIPSKIFLESARRAREAAEGASFGLVGSPPTGWDLAAVRRRKVEILAERAAGAQKVCDTLGITVIAGTADVEDAHHVTVAAGGSAPHRLETRAMILAPGSRSRPLEVPGGDGPGIWTSREALDLVEVPPRLCIIGGGYIGMELATLYQTLGSHVTILEAGPRVLPSEDPLIVDHLLKTWRQWQVPAQIETRVTVDRIEALGSPDGRKVVHYTTPDAGPQRLEVDRVLVAVGRVPNTGGLSWSRIGLSLGPDGAVPVNQYYQTAVPHIYAPGDVNGQVLLAHAATRQSLIAAQHWLGAPTFPPVLVVPHVIFTAPEIAAVGADSRALADHPSWQLTRWPYQQDARALILGDAEGYAQLIWDRASHEIHGLQVIGRDAGELIEEVTYVITHGGTVDELVASIHPHPTLNEAISELASAALQSAP